MGLLLSLSEVMTIFPRGKFSSATGNLQEKAVKQAAIYSSSGTCDPQEKSRQNLGPSSHVSQSASHGLPWASLSALLR